MKPFLLLALAVATSSCSDRSAERAAAVSAKAAEEATARGEADARREQARLVALWTYTTTPAGRGQQVTAAIRSVEDVDTDGKGVRPVTLVFRDHPAWGKSSYLLLQAGDFNCGASCTVKITADTAPSKPMAARRPNDRRSDRHVHQRRARAVSPDDGSEADQYRVSDQGRRHPHAPHLMWAAWIGPRCRRRGRPRSPAS